MARIVRIVYLVKFFRSGARLRSKASKRTQGRKRKYNYVGKRRAQPPSKVTKKNNSFENYTFKELVDSPVKAKRKTHINSHSGGLFEKCINSIKNSGKKREVSLPEPGSRRSPKFQQVNPDTSFSRPIVPNSSNYASYEPRVLIHYCLTIIYSPNLGQEVDYLWLQHLSMIL